MGRIFRLALAVLATVAAAPAVAAWHEARSPHFVVYADDKPAAVRALAERLERFDAFIRLYHAMPEDASAGANPVTIYQVSSIGAIQKLMGARNVAGFYVGRASGAIAFTPKRMDGDYGADLVLFHEYAHHFLLGNYVQAYPAWFSEGYAEFV